MERFIISPFNTVFYVCLALCAAFLLIVHLIFRNKSEKEKRKFVAINYIIFFLFFFVYKYLLSIDAPYSIILANNGEGGFSWWTELPFNLCNITLIITPIAVITNNRFLKSFCFFISPLGALMALVMPAVGFYGYSIFMPRCIGYYLTHFAALLSGPMIYILGLYRPRREDVLTTFVYFFIISLIIFIINMLLRLFNLTQYSNYYYLMYPAGNPALEFAWHYIPIPFVYLLPFGFAAIPLMYLEAWIFKARRKKYLDC